MRDLRWLAVLRPGQRVVAGEGVGVQPALEPGEVAPRPLALAVRRVAVERRRRAGAAPGPRVEGVDPEPGLARLAPPRRQHADWRVVGPDHALAHGVGPDRLGQRPQPPGAAADPVGERLPLDLHSLARQDAREAVQRQAVEVLRDQHMREQAGAGPALLDRQVGRRRLQDRLAGAAGVAGPDVADHLQPRRDLLEDLGDVLAEPGQAREVGAAAATGGGGLVEDRLARQVLRQRLAERGAPLIEVVPGFRTGG